MIFAAGLGTRLKPITDTMPKALVPVCGQPLLYHVITKLVAAGYDDLVVNVHHFPDQIIHYLHSHDFGARIAVSDERDFLRETGGGIRYAKHLLTDFSTPPAAPLEMTEELSFRPSEASGEICLSEPFLVHNVDIVSNLDLNWLREQHREGALVTLVASERKTLIDPDRCRKLAFAGVHLMSPAIFDAFDRYGFGDRFSIVDFYLRACADYPIYAAVPPDFQLVDVGKFDALPEAEATCAKILND